MYDPLRAKAKVAVYSVVAFVFGMGMASGLGWTSPSHAMPAIIESPQIPTEAIQPAVDLSEAFTTLANAVTPAVVRIESRREVSAARQEVPDVFRRFFPDAPEDQPPSQGQISGGSGFIVSGDGYIMTNNHVVEGANQVRVFFPDRRYYEAEVVGADPYTDVAVIKVDVEEELPAMAIGNSDQIRVGEWVLAIGNPGFGSSTQLDFTVTAGIISAQGRGLRLLQRDLFNNPQFGPENSRWAIENFIQTDAVINPGNSGGPLVNLRGQVIGINSAIASTTGVYQGYGFAVPINLARRVMEDLIEFGHVRRPRIGVEIQDVVAEDAAVYGLPSVSGVLVQNVDPRGPSAGELEAEDVIVELDGQRVGYVAELQAKIAERHPGEQVELTVYRDGRPVEVTIRLDEAPINETPEATVARSELAADRLGINVEALDGTTAERAGFSDPGVVLTEVAPGSAAARRGVANYQGNKLVRINDARVETPEDVRAALERVEAGDIVSLHFQSPQGEERVVNVRMPA